MPDPKQPGMPCSEFDALLTEAVEGRLIDAEMLRFRTHAESCGVCGPMFAEALAGYTWLNSLVEIEPPANLVHNILAATSEQAARSTQAAQAELGFGDRFRGWFRDIATPLLQPRFAGTFAMAIFSLGLMVNVLGIKVSSLRHADLRPVALVNGVTHQFYTAQSRVVKYYDNLRFVYQFESTVRELREVMPADKDDKDRPKSERKNKQPGDSDLTKDRNKNDKSRSNDNREEERFSQESGQMTLAAWHPPSTKTRIASAIRNQQLRNSRRSA